MHTRGQSSDRNIYNALKNNQARVHAKRHCIAEELTGITLTENDIDTRNMTEKEESLCDFQEWQRAIEAEKKRASAQNAPTSKRLTELKKKNPPTASIHPRVLLKGQL